MILRLSGNAGGEIINKNIPACEAEPVCQKNVHLDNLLGDTKQYLVYELFTRLVFECDAAG